jgi:hypothetical protein
MQEVRDDDDAWERIVNVSSPTSTGEVLKSHILFGYRQLPTWKARAVHR